MTSSQTLTDRSLEECTNSPCGHRRWLAAHATGHDESLPHHVSEAAYPNGGAAEGDPTRMYGRGGVGRSAELFLLHTNHGCGSHRTVANNNEKISMNRIYLTTI